MTRAPMAIPPNPSRWRVRRPAFSTRKSWRAKSGERDEWPEVHFKLKDLRRITYRDNREDGVDDAGSYGGINGLLHAG